MLNVISLKLLFNPEALLKHYLYMMNQSIDSTERLQSKNGHNH